MLFHVLAPDPSDPPLLSPVSMKNNMLITPLSLSLSISKEKEGRQWVFKTRQRQIRQHLTFVAYLFRRALLVGHRLTCLKKEKLYLF